MKKRCQYCGREGLHWFERNGTGWYCRQELPCFNRILNQKRALEDKLKNMRSIGGQMANLCFNLSQQEGRVLGKDVAGLMRDMYNQWDGVKR